MTTDARRQRLSRLAAQDLDRAASHGRRSVVTMLCDVGFWLVYAVVLALLAMRL